MDNTVSRCLKIVQKCRHHGGGLSFGVMKQHDSATIGIETRHYEPQFLVGGHAVPIARPEVGAEHHNARSARRSSKPGVDAKPGKRKNGVCGCAEGAP